MVNHSTNTFGFTQPLHNFRIVFVIKLTIFQSMNKTIGVFDSFIRGIPILFNLTSLFIAVKTCITVVCRHVAGKHSHINVTVKNKGFLISIPIKVVHQNGSVNAVQCTVNFSFLTKYKFFAIA